MPLLSELPPPPRGLTGWPWTVESESLPKQTAGNQPWPRVTVITPSFNQSAFLEQAIRSVLLQGYPNLEYIVLDGGSSDGSTEIIKKYVPWLHHWESGPDGGQSKAINRGFTLGSGDWVTWINSDDMLCLNGLTNHLSAHTFQPDIVYVGICPHLDAAGNLIETHQGRVHTLEELVRIPQVWRASGYIDQPAVLFPLELARSAGGLNPDNHRTMDYELWGKFLLAGARFQYTEIPFGAFRVHSGQKTADMLEQTNSLLETAASFVRRPGCFEASQREEILADLSRYHAEFRERHWRGTGRLARLGLYPPLVTLLRNAMNICLKPARVFRGTDR